MIYNIPGDTGNSWRFDRFAEYMLAFPDEVKGMAQRFLKDNPRKSELDDAIWLIFLYSCCYSYPTAFVLYRLIDYRHHYAPFELEYIWRTNKPKLIFQSDRRYIKHMDQFTTMVTEFLEHIQGEPWRYISQFWDKDDIPVSYDAVYREVNSWKYFGRFGTGLFIYNLWKLTPMVLDHPSYDWKHGSTTTAAFFTMLYNDERGEDFGKRKNAKSVAPLSKHELKVLDTMLADTMSYFRKSSPERNFSVLQVTADSCSYYKMYKGVRYQGFYVDRQQEELYSLYKSYPEHRDVWNTCWEERRNTIPAEYLGELNGWPGVRKEKMLDFLTTGKV